MVAHPAAARRCILGLIAAHLALVVYHKHTQFPGPGRTEGNVVGYPVFPVYTAKAGGFFFIVFGVIALMGATDADQPGLGVRPVQPGRGHRRLAARLVHGLRRGRASGIMPNWEWHIGSTTWSWNVRHTRSRTDGSVLRRDGDLPVHRGLGHRRQARAPHPGPAPQQPDPHGLRRGGDDLATPCCGSAAATTWSRLSSTCH